MRRAFRHLPIRLKLIAMIVSTCAAALVLASLGYLVLDYYKTRDELRNDLRAQADLILENTLGSLSFEVKEDARQILSTLGSKPNIRLACLYDADDRLFADYHHPGETGECPGKAVAPDTQFGSEFAQTSGVGYDGGKKFGSVLIRSDLAALARRGRYQLAIVALLLALALAVAVLMSSKLQTIVSEPVMALAGTAGEVTRRGDYSLRAARTTDDELGALVDAFNRMLETIQARETELSKANEELRREIVERRRAEQERAELLVREREANRLKDEFLATLSHELRTPLNAILGWTKLLRANAVPTAGVDRALEKVERNAQVQSRLIEDLLEVSRIVSGKLRLDHRPFDLVNICHLALDSIRPLAQARDVTVTRHFAPASMPTAGDPDRLQQVIWNLLSNAVKFTPPGGHASLTVRRAGDVDEIVVSDTGIGIDPAFLPNVFESFRQADASTTRTHGGLGLGLSIVKQLVALHGGQVRAESAGKDRGATFTVSLPVRAAERKRPDDGVSRPDQAAGRLSGRDILVVDDDPDTRELLVAAFQGAGGLVRAAGSSAEALALTLDRRPEAVVSDLGMPGEDGYMFMQRLTRMLGEGSPRVRIALSAFAASHDRERALAVGFQRHVAKPVDPHALVRLLYEMLEDSAGAAT